MPHYAKRLKDAIQLLEGIPGASLTWDDDTILPDHPDKAGSWECVIPSGEESYAVVNDNSPQRAICLAWLQWKDQQK